MDEFKYESGRLNLPFVGHCRFAKSPICTDWDQNSKGNIIGIDLVEVAPVYDHADVTSILAAQVLLNAIGYIFHARSQPT